MSRFLNKQYEKLEPYVPGEQPKALQVIKLNTNESPYPPSPSVTEAVSGEELSRLRLYSDPEAKELVTAISEYYGVPASRVIATNGSDEILAFSFMAFQNGEGKVYFPDISYGFYKVYAEIFGVDAKTIPLDENLRIRSSDYKNLDATIVIANPNAPTGIALSLPEIEEILVTNRDNLVLIDEAYVDFGAESCIPLTEKYDNLLVVQTFSKSRNLAGARIGFGIANEEIIKDLNKIKFSFNPYNLNRLSILAGVAAMKDEAYFDRCVKEIQRTRESFKQQMEEMGFSILPSAANFVFAKHEKFSGKVYFEGLRKRNILVRHFENDRIKDYVRITIGKEEDMEALLKATWELLKEEELAL